VEPQKLSPHSIVIAALGEPSKAAIDLNASDHALPMTLSG